MKQIDIFFPHFQSKTSVAQYQTELGTPVVTGQS